MKNIYTLGLVMVVILIISCKNNQICYNNKENYIYSCDDYFITKLRVTDKNEFITYYFKPINGKIKRFYLFDSFQDYKIIGSYQDNISHFNFERNKTYEISNISEGDATPARIKLFINSDRTVRVIE